MVISYTVKKAEFTGIPVFYSIYILCAHKYIILSYNKLDVIIYDNNRIIYIIPLETLVNVSGGWFWHLVKSPGFVKVEA